MATQFLAGARLLAVKLVSYLVGLPPIEVMIGRQRFYVNPKTGRLMPAVAGASPDDPAADDKGGDDKGDKGDDADDDDDDDKVTPDDDWQAKARKHERAAKKERREREKLQKQLDDAAAANKTDQQKAIDDAVQAAKDEAAKERRNDRLEVACTRLAAKGIKVGDDDGVKFADTEDALLWIQKRIDAGDLDEDEIFDDKGKVKTDGLSSALSEILAEKPHLRAGGAGDGEGSSTGKEKPSGDSDAGKGKKGAEGQLKSTEGMSSAEIAKAVEEGRLDDYLKQSN